MELEDLLEWAVWAHLESKNDPELILLKGHLLLDVVLNRALSKNDIKGTEDFSFYRKITLLKGIETNDRKKLDMVIGLLTDLNRFRNGLAHEFQFDINDGQFDAWSQKILTNFEGMKFRRYTYRTKIVHSFSILTKNILELSNVISADKKQ